MFFLFWGVCGHGHHLFFCKLSLLQPPFPGYQSWGCVQTRNKPVVDHLTLAPTPDTHFF